MPNGVQQCRRLLAQAEDLAVLEQLPEHVRMVLAEFSRQTVPEDTRKQAADAAYSLENDALWTLQDRSYADWVCRLCVALLLRASSAKLAACRSAAARKPALAELLLPYALADLAARDSDSSLLRTISAQVRLLSGRFGAVFPDVVKVCLKAMSDTGPALSNGGLGRLAGRCLPYSVS